MGGMIPRTDPRLIGDTMAEESINVDLTSGQLIGLPQVMLATDLSSTPGPVERAYLLPGPDGQTPVWLPLPSRYSSIVRSPLTNDDQNRVYWTNPGDPVPWFTTYADIVAGNPPYNLGEPQPTDALTITDAEGGDTSVPEIARSYMYTWANSFGEETAPSPASNVFEGQSDGTWTITGFPTSPPANPAGVNYPPVTTLILYRTVTGDTSGAQFYEVTRWDYPNVPAVYQDTIPDTTVVNNRVLESLGWGNAPTGLDGLTALPGGMLVGFTDNTVHFCEPDRPHTWPSVYDQSVHYTVIALAVWQQYLMVLTEGFPSTGSGSTPSNFLLVQSRVPEPCVARGSVITDLLAVYYASQNGLIQISGYGMQNQSMLMVDREQWLNRYMARDIIACRHRAQYMAINGTNSAFIVDYAEQRLGFEDLSTFQDVVCIWNDEFAGDTYLCADKKIYLWDSPTTPRLPYRWLSKRFFTPLPISLGAAQITLGPEITASNPPDVMTPPLDNGEGETSMPAGVNAVFNYYAGPDFQLIMSRNLTKQQEIFRLPAGFKAFDHQFEIVAIASCYSVQVATTLEELKQV